MFFSIFRSPKGTDDQTALHASCLGGFGGPIFPYDVLDGYHLPAGANPRLTDEDRGCCKVTSKYRTSTVAYSVLSNWRRLNATFKLDRQKLIFHLPRNGEDDGEEEAEEEKDEEKEEQKDEEEG